MEWVRLERRESEVYERKKKKKKKDEEKEGREEKCGCSGGSSV